MSHNHEIHWIAPSEITPYYQNPRKNEQAILKVAESIQTFGFNQPIVIDADHTIVVGHTRWKAALKLDLDTVPVIQVELDEDKARAYRIADNRTGEEAGWDFESLAAEFESLPDDLFTGFDKSEVQDILNIIPDFEPGNKEEQGRLDEFGLIECPECGHEFTT